MALQPVSGVTPLRTNNIAFSGRRNDREDYQAPARSGIPTSVKAVPVIVLMAMSPLNNINANRPISDFPETNEIEMVSTTQAVKKPKIIDTAIFEDQESKTATYKFNRLDLDGNPNTFEAVEIIRYVPYSNKEISQRGIITSVFLDADENNKNVRLHLYGVGLSKTNLNSYEPEGRYLEIKRTSYNQGSLEDVRLYLAILNMEKGNNSSFKFTERPMAGAGVSEMIRKLNECSGQ